MKIISTYGVILFATLFFLSACSAVKYVPEGKHLLAKSNVKIDDAKDLESIAKTYLKQKSNTRFLGFWKMYLDIYNLSGRNEKKKINKFLRKVGEAPIVYDSLKIRPTVLQLGRFMKSRGYYDAKISTISKFGKKKVSLTYNIKAGKPKTIRKIWRNKHQLSRKIIGSEAMRRELPDSSLLRKILVQDVLKSYLKVGEPFSTEILNKERARLVKVCKNQGYYGFEEDNIHFYVDSTSFGNNAVSIYYGLSIKNKEEGKKYKLRKIFVNIVNEGDDITSKAKMLVYNNIIFKFYGNLLYKPQVLSKFIIMEEGQIYNPEKAELTSILLRQLKQFRIVNIRFSKVVDSHGELGLLDCNIKMSPYKSQSYSVNATATVNSGDFGFEGGLQYNNKNLFRGAELLTVDFSAGGESLSKGLPKSFNAYKFIGAVSLTIPKFILPFFGMKNWRKNSPKTKLSCVVNYSERPEYKRSITDLSFGYIWQSKSFIQHRLIPIDFGVLQVDAEQEFLSKLSNYYRRTSYVDHIIAAARYRFIFNNQGSATTTNYLRFKFNIETAGNLLNWVSKVLNRSKHTSSVFGGKESFYKYLGIRYAQYVRSNFEIVYNQYINRNHSMIYRLFGGVGIPYGNSKVLPFNKMYFAGGSSGIRAWQPRSLGPGSSQNISPLDRMSYGEIKLEGNLEYRFPIFEQVEGALFADFGNVWNFPDVNNKYYRGEFRWDDFYKNLGIGTGLGVRIFFNSIILRLDTGVKVLDPYLDEKKRFVPLNGGWKFKDIVFNFGIGYPF